MVQSHGGDVRRTLPAVGDCLPLALDRRYQTALLQTMDTNNAGKESHLLGDQEYVHSAQVELIVEWQGRQPIIGRMYTGI